MPFGGGCKSGRAVGGCGRFGFSNGDGRLPGSGAGGHGRGDAGGRGEQRGLGEDPPRRLPGRSASRPGRMFHPDTGKSSRAGGGGRHRPIRLAGIDLGFEAAGAALPRSARAGSGGGSLRTGADRGQRNHPTNADLPAVASRTSNRLIAGNRAGADNHLRHRQACGCAGREPSPPRDRQRLPGVV